MARKINTPAPLIGRSDATLIPVLHEVRADTADGLSRPVVGYTVMDQDDKVQIGTCDKVQGEDAKGKAVTLWQAVPTGARKGAKVQTYTTRREAIMRTFQGAFLPA